LLGVTLDYALCQEAACHSGNITTAHMKNQTRQYIFCASHPNTDSYLATSPPNEAKLSLGGLWMMAWKPVLIEQELGVVWL